MPQHADDARSLERRFFDSQASQHTIRVSVRALVILDGHVLVQRLNHAESVRWFPGGEVDFGESLEAALRRELAEETTLRINTITYRFVANNRFERDGNGFHFLEHYFEVTPDGTDLETVENHFGHDWLPIADTATIDIRPFAVRDILRIPGWRNLRLLETD